MLYLADFEHKQIYENDVSVGSNPAVLYDNVSRKCALLLDDKMYSCQSVGKKAVAASKYEADAYAATPAAFGELSVGQRVYDFNGKFLGEVENAQFTSKLILRKIWVRDAEFARGQIASVGDAVIIRAKSPRQLLQQREKTKRTVTAAAPPSLTQQTSQQTATATSATSPAATIAPAQQDEQPLPPHDEPTSQTPAQPTVPAARIRKRYGNFNFLLGKTADKTIVNFQGEVMIKKSETVTKEILRQAKISGKLIELYLHVE